MRFSEFIRPIIRGRKMIRISGKKALIVRVEEPLLRLQKKRLIRTMKEKRRSRTGTPVCIREPRLPYRWALASSSFKAPRRRPSICRDYSRYISWLGTYSIAQSNKRSKDRAEINLKRLVSLWAFRTHNKRFAVQICKCDPLQIFENKVWSEKTTGLSHIYRQLFAIGERVHTLV